MKILIVDDERPARAELRYILEQLQADATIDEATTGEAALEAYDVAASHAAAFDVVILDINMPGMGGLAAAAELATRVPAPLIVFATAYDSHAVRAFELAALDYVVKPFAEARLAQTMVRVRARLAAGDTGARQRTALDAAQRLRSGVNKLWAERADRTGVLVDFRDVMWIGAEGRQVTVQTVAGEQLALRQTLKELEEMLAGAHILRVHKAYLVNLDHVAEIVPWFSGAFLLRMRDDARTEIPMSRQYAREFKQLFG